VDGSGHGLCNFQYFLEGTDERQQISQAIIVRDEIITQGITKQEGQPLQPTMFIQIVLWDETIILHYYSMTLGFYWKLSDMTSVN
jgi:hypothetical protein